MCDKCIAYHLNKSKGIEPPRDAEGMLIGHPQLRLETIRAAGLDPDGLLIPMRPAGEAKRLDAEAVAEINRRYRDAALIRALRYTNAWRP